MKNVIIYSGIALVIWTNSTNTSFDVKTRVVALQESKKEMLVNKGFKTVALNESVSNSKKLSTLNNPKVVKPKTLYLRNFPKTTLNKPNGELEPIEVVSIQKNNKTAEELIAEDNLITENNISNETQALDLEVINRNTIGYEGIEFVNTSKKEKTAEELIAEDNVITGNNISNETQALDFDWINSNTIGYVDVEPVNISKIEKTADELIAEDNLITGNNISNETRALDFKIINKNSISWK